MDVKAKGVTQKTSVINVYKMKQQNQTLLTHPKFKFPKFHQQEGNTKPAFIKTRESMKER